MQFFDFIFLKRNWDSDRKRLAKAFDIMAVEKQPIWLMLFPEGTLISDQTMEVNLAYAEKAGLDVSLKKINSEYLQYELLPSPSLVTAFYHERLD